MELKQVYYNALRKARLLSFYDRLHYRIGAYKTRNTDREFVARYPAEPFPPKEMIYKSTGSIGYEQYFISGQRAARNLVKLIQQYSDLEDKNILEWGCGVSRILRHLAKIGVNSNSHIFGTDMDWDMTDWNAGHFPGIKFRSNKILPSTDFEDSFFDIIYCTEVFCHLTETVQQQWLLEIGRILKKDGLFLFTTQGDYYAHQKLTTTELEQYLEGYLIMHGNVADGSRLMETFQSPAYVTQKMLNGFELLEHITDETLQIAGRQDIWIVKKS